MTNPFQGCLQIAVISSFNRYRDAWRTLRTLGRMLFDDRIGLRVAPYLQLNVFPLDLIVQYLRAPGTFTFLQRGQVTTLEHLHIMWVSCASLTFLHVISCCIMQAYTGWQQLSCVIGAKTPVMLGIKNPPIWIIAILLPIPRDKWTCWSWEPTGSDLGRKDSADLVSRGQWFSPTNISPHVHLQQKSGAKVKHLESSHELTARNAQALWHDVADGCWHPDDLMVFCSDQHLSLPCTSLVAPLRNLLHHTASVSFVDLKRNNAGALPSNRQSHQKQLFFLLVNLYLCQYQRPLGIQSLYGVMLFC